jgi:hypothetical protein
MSNVIDLAARRSVQIEYTTELDDVGTCRRDDDGKLYVFLAGPQVSDVGFGFTPHQARVLASRLLSVAFEVEKSNG